MIYLDWNATTPPHPDVIAAMQEAGAEAWANPASVHRPGQRARAELDRARAAVASLVGMHARDVVLTSGGTEANNLALESGRGGLVVSVIEHPSVVQKAEALAAQGVSVRWVRPDSNGRVSVEAFERALGELESLALVSLQAVNHETGVVQPVAEVARLARARGARLHVDAVQAVGKLEPKAWAGADLVSVAAHKIRGPKGIGALAVLPGVRLQPVLRGGAQERGLRPGTQDATLAAGFAIAAQRALDGPARYAKLESLRDRFERELMAIAARSHIEVIKNGDAPRAPHVSNLSWLGFRGPELCAALDLEGVAVSSGAACSAGTAEPSPVITAMAGEARALSAVRASLGDATSDADIDAALAAFARVIGRHTS